MTFLWATSDKERARFLTCNALLTSFQRSYRRILLSWFTIQQWRMIGNFLQLMYCGLVSSRNGTGNNGTNGKVGKNSTCFQYWGGGLEFERGVWGENFGFVLEVLELGVGFWVRGGCSRVGGLGWRFEFGKI